MAERAWSVTAPMRNAHEARAFFNVVCSDCVQASERESYHSTYVPFGEQTDRIVVTLRTHRHDSAPPVGASVENTAVVPLIL